jgi:hypothetical protein
MGLTKPTRTRGRSLRRGRALLAGAIACAAAWLVPAVGALAFSEPVAGGDTTLTLALPGKISASPNAPATANGSSIVFPNTGGVVDADRGTARLDLGGGVAFAGKKRGKVDVTGLKYNAGTSGIINASVKGEQMAFATVSGAIQAGSLEATLGGAPALLTADAAKKLNRALGKKKKGKGKGKAAAQASKKKKFKKIFKEGDSIGTVSTSATLKTLPVQAQGNGHLVPDPGSVPKFDGKGVNALLGGVSPVPPATAAGPLGLSTAFDFPVSGGRVAPDLSVGQLATSGGLQITKNASNGAACDAQKPIGTFIKQTDLTIDFERKQLLSTIDSTGGFVGADVITADLDFANATVSVSPSGELEIQTLGVYLLQSSATTLNGIFGTEAQGCGADFQAGDKLGDLNVTAQLG